MFATRRRLVLTAAAGALLAACQPSGGGKVSAAGEDPSDMAIGDPNAPVKIIEYASVTCPHCREFHETVWPSLKANYIDTGKVRLIFREFPTNPAELAVAGFQVARCGGKGPEQYFTMLDALFDQQIAIFQAFEQGAAKDKLLAIAKSAGISDDQFAKCVGDPEGVKRIDETVQNAQTRFKVDGTPTLIVNAEKLTAAQTFDYATLAKLIDAKIGGK
jgi:protein-disulfide isomerase